MCNKCLGSELLFILRSLSPPLIWRLWCYHSKENRALWVLSIFHHGWTARCRKYWSCLYNIFTLSTFALSVLYIPSTACYFSSLAEFQWNPKGSIPADVPAGGPSRWVAVRLLFAGAPRSSAESQGGLRGLVTDTAMKEWQISSSRCLPIVSRSRQLSLIIIVLQKQRELNWKAILFFQMLNFHWSWESAVVFWWCQDAAETSAIPSTSQISMRNSYRDMVKQWVPLGYPIAAGTHRVILFKQHQAPESLHHFRTLLPNQMHILGSKTFQISHLNSRKLQMFLWNLEKVKNRLYWKV